MFKSILLFFLLTITSFAQYITPDTGINWNMDDLVSNSGGVVTGSFPNYEVNNNVVISLSDQINIDPGSIVSFTSADAGFEVNGIINCQGTETDSILFTSPLADSTGSYTGLKFNESANSSNSIISYTKIEYADNGMRCINSSPTLTHSYILKCNNGAQLTGSNSEISYCKIERNYGYGITMTLTSSPLIKNNIIANNNTQNTSPKNQISIGLQGNNSPVIMDNIIYGSVYEKTGGISLWVNGSTNFSNMVVEGNTIYNNSFGITLYSTGDGIINAVVKNNSIYDNNINPSQLTSGSGININGSPSNTPIITGNEIYGNWWGITIQNGTTIQPGPQPNIGNIENADTTDDGNNIIYDNIQGTDVYDLYNNTTTNIMAQNNDWHVYDSTAIEDHIFHHVDDPQLGYVIFVPFYEVVPVEFTSFSSTVMKNKVQLNWSTATESNNKGFEIERIKRKNGSKW